MSSCAVAYRSGQAAICGLCYLPSGGSALVQTGNAIAFGKA
jgi:hypothetical protein